MNEWHHIIQLIRQYELELSAFTEIRDGGGLKSTTTANGGLCVMTISAKTTPVLPATCSDLGIFLHLYCNIADSACLVESRVYIEAVTLYWHCPSVVYSCN